MAIKHWTTINHKGERCRIVYDDGQSKPVILPYMCYRSGTLVQSMRTLRAAQLNLAPTIPESSWVFSVKSEGIKI